MGNQMLGEGGKMLEAQAESNRRTRICNPLITTLPLRQHQKKKEARDGVAFFI